MNRNAVRRPYRGPDYLRVVRDDRLHFLEDHPASPAPTSRARAWLSRAAEVGLVVAWFGGVGLCCWAIAYLVRR